jgi:ABC-type polysaccharide/polyol phosphate transport system ATPase subunit
MEQDINIIEAENINLNYKLVTRTNIKQGLLNWKNRTKMVSGDFHALKYVSFEIKKGHNVGLIGANGAGKSTLLRILARTMAPDSGRLVIRANSISLLALGLGFNPELSGRENIYLNGLLLGFSKKELDQRVEEIVEYAEVGEFIDNPVRSYSSGMRSKLAFSISSNIEPELLLIDELFSVGDEKFQKKSGERIQKMIQDDRTVVMVSHSMSNIQQYCDSAIWLDKGEVKAMGDTAKVIEEYHKFINR